MLYAVGERGDKIGAFALTVYVDDMYRYPIGRLKVGRYAMKMSHMIADTDAELHAMAVAIGVARRWYQGDHYDISLSKRAIAVARGAVEITYRQCGLMSSNRKVTGSLGAPETAREVWEAIRGAREAGANPQLHENESLPAAAPACHQGELFTTMDAPCKSPPLTPSNVVAMRPARTRSSAAAATSRLELSGALDLTSTRMSS